MKDPELDVLIDELEQRTDLSVADFDGIAHGLAFLIPDAVKADDALARKLNQTDEAIHVADAAFPNWTVRIRGRANDRDGHWRVTLRKDDSRDSDEAIGTARSPVLAQAVLAAVMRLAMILKKD